ncbi:Glucosidase 2 subunit beta [Tolypocladium capitatum]|uniref:Glucosidase 2 subunit beta n=1 Tax=Tolypocladium capitatum TaxID=45235 RepID=A0A2K3QCB5_9HYPO|nr:Glucosidase 2 subunit beta [Tolypocladium capitatum]
MKPYPALPPGSRRLYTLCLHLAVGASIWGYNIGVLSSVLVHPGWTSTLGDPSAAQKGVVTGIYYLGTLLSYVLLSHPLADWLGRRHGALVGTLVLCLGALVMACADGAAALGTMALGRWLCGLGVGVVSTSVPLYQSEVAPAEERGKFVTLNHVGFITGLASGARRVGYGMTYWTGPAGEYWGWRVSILIQLLPALVFAAGLPRLPDTPRWLVQKGDMERARRVLHWLREGTCAAPETTAAHELRAISADVESRRRVGQTSLSLSLSLLREAPLLARLWRAFLLQFMAQMCGATAMKYYLPTLLRALGMDTRLALMAGAVEMTAKIGMAVVEMWVIDRFGRRACLVGGCVVMGVAMLVRSSLAIEGISNHVLTEDAQINGALPLAYPQNANTAADVVCIAFIFIYAMGYSLGLGPAAWVYSSEIFPTSVRARGLNFAASGGSIGSILVAHIWPVGIARLGSGIYFFFMAVNALCVPASKPAPSPPLLPLRHREFPRLTLAQTIWMLYPETKGRALENMDGLFGKSHARNSAVSRDGAARGGEGWHEPHEGGGEARQSAEDSTDEDAPLMGR